MSKNRRCPVGIWSRRIEAENRAATKDVIGFLHLGDVRERTAGALPYGSQKWGELARALVARPTLLLLDEPFAGVTLSEKLALSEHVRHARNSYGATIVLIEHDMGVVMGLSGRIAVLDNGRKIADGASRSGGGRRLPGSRASGRHGARDLMFDYQFLVESLVGRLLSGGYARWSRSASC
ncbi:Bicarbonate transport ATP-binding protein CmpD [Bradyrhizobium ivorense]|nr:Bicarbonate transport ATP-binding protein CmpD [Bradyrhizobium ivorense]